jgi:putative tryptophan/tyrosine transport system substrate-binding protein
MILRREVITLLGGAATWPLAVRAQQLAIPRVGVLCTGSPASIAVAGFRKGLSESGYVDGQNTIIEYRWAQNQIDRLPELAADRVRRRMTVIVASDSEAALAAKSVPTAIPIVFEISGDPVQIGLVAGLALRRVSTTR